MKLWLFRFKIFTKSKSHILNVTTYKEKKLDPIDLISLKMEKIGMN